MKRRWHGVLALVVFAAPGLSMQAQRSDAACRYSQCGLSIVPHLTGLTLVRGDAETPVASLAFLWPSNVSAAFAGDSIALSIAGHATRERRVAMIMTDVGGLLVAGGLVKMFHDGDRIHGAPAFTGLGGFLLVGASVPMQFAADADLSRAVWQYNRRFEGAQ